MCLAEQLTQKPSSNDSNHHWGFCAASIFISIIQKKNV